MWSSSKTEDQVLAKSQFYGPISGSNTKPSKCSAISRKLGSLFSRSDKNHEKAKSAESTPQLPGGQLQADYIRLKDESAKL